MKIFKICSKIFNFKSYLTIFLLLIYISNAQYISIPFKNSRSLFSLLKNLNTEKIYDYLIETDITINIEIGTPPQIIPTSLSLWNKYIYITSNELDIGLYDKNKSLSFETNNEEAFSDQLYYKKGLYCSDIFHFHSDNNLKNEKLSFILAKSMEYSTEYRKGLIGLQITSYKQEDTFINQLKRKELINNYYHFMYFKDEDNGEFVIGTLPHEYDNKKYSYINFRQVNAREISQSWELTITNIKYGETKFDDKIFDLDFKFGMISVSLMMKHAYYNDFFEKRIKKGLCEEFIYKNYYIYSCINDEKKVKFKELKDFHFYNKGLENDFVFTYKDLFITINNRKYFLITYKINSMTTILGKPFFKKYTIGFNPDNKQIIHYIKEEVDKSSLNKKNIYFILVIILLIVILISLGYILFKFIRKKARKTIIDENYEYFPEEKKLNLEMIKI